MSLPEAILNTSAFARKSSSLIVALLLILLQAFCFAAQPLVKAPQVDMPMRVLFVGNSYFYYNDSLHNHVARMLAIAAPSREARIEFRSATIGGASLAQHNVDYLTQVGRLGVKQLFDLVILQGGSSEPLSERRRAAFQRAVLEANQVVTSRGAKLALYMTPSYVAPHAHVNTDNMRFTEDAYVAAGNEVQALVIPVGLAFEEAYRRRPDLQLHNKIDGSHPSMAGTYLAACTVLASVYGISPVGNSYDYYGAIDRETAAFLQQVAYETVERFFAAH